MTTATEVPQWQEALARGNEIRLARVQIKRSLTCGGELLELLQDPPEAIKGQEVADLVRSVPRLGKHYACEILNDAHIPHGRLVRDLTERERGRLILRLRQSATWGRA